MENQVTEDQPTPENSGSESNVSDQDLSVNPESTPEGNGVENSVSPEQSLWEQDKRFETMWDKNPDNLYKSYKALETKLNDNGASIRSEYDEKIKGMQGDLDQYGSLKQYLTTIENHPELSGKFREMIEGFNKQLNREKYGADLPEEVMSRLDEFDSLKEHIQKGEQEKLVQQNLDVINKQFDEINEFADRHNLSYDEQEFLAYAKENNISPEFMKAAFVNQVLPQVEESIRSKTQQSVLKNREKGRSASPPSGGKPPASRTETQSLDQALRSVL